jgi:glycosyltransferase involved in cell wall biosynthesis
MNLRILCFVDYYLPGYKAGGPIRAVANIVNQLSDEFEFFIVTRDRDFSDAIPYSGILIDQWNKVGKSKVFYASPATFSFFGLMRLLNEIPHDILYLNSFFSSKATILPLFIRLIGLSEKKPIILAPRGEFSVEALALKASKKKLYLGIFKWLKIHQKLIFQASSAYESEDIFRVVGLSNIIVAEDLVFMGNHLIREPVSRINKFRTPGPLRIVFLSRISPMKNLDYLLLSLGKVNAAVEFSIYGPIEDVKYWSLCQKIIQNLPANINLSYKSEVKYEQVPQILGKYDLFVFPTRGENFGHVIFESLSVGTSVIISDKTLWQPDLLGAVEVIGLENIDVWTAAISKWALFNDKDFIAQRAAAISYAGAYLENSQGVKHNRELFLSAFTQKRRTS